MNLSNIVPWGRSCAEYRAMFALSDADLRGRVLGCGDGPASFNAEATALGAQIVSVDPIYMCAAVEIEAWIVSTFSTMMSQLRAEADRYVWEKFPDPEALGAARLKAMQRFLADYETGRQTGRYIPAALPNLPFADATFDLALCSHFLLLYTDRLSLADHISSARELLRVATEVRIFPLLTLSGERSPHLSALGEALIRERRAFEERIVDYEFQRGGNVMLRLRQGPRGQAGPTT